MPQSQNRKYDIQQTWAEANTHFCRNRAFDEWPKWCLFLEKSCNQEKDYGAEQKQCLTYKGKKKDWV